MGATPPPLDSAPSGGVLEGFLPAAPDPGLPEEESRWPIRWPTGGGYPPLQEIVSPENPFFQSRNIIIFIFKKRKKNADEQTP
jgi:hypothetical protein